jgi:hypothetical protein
VPLPSCKKGVNVASEKQRLKLRGRRMFVGGSRAHKKFGSVGYPSSAFLLLRWKAEVEGIDTWNCCIDFQKGCKRGVNF